ncbi:MAG: AraC family transcriptional regulator [Pseudomonadota bacterium]
MIPSVETLRAKLESSGKTVPFARVTKDGQACTCRFSCAAHTDILCDEPILMWHLCLECGGPLEIRTEAQTLSGDIGPGAVVMIPPKTNGIASWPEMTAVSVGIADSSVRRSLGKTWQDALKSGPLSRAIHDPLVAAIMTDVGYTRAGRVPDAGLTHAAHVILHQLLEQPDDDTVAGKSVQPLGRAALARIDQMLADNPEIHISVPEMARLAGISRYHFSRRFKAATGQTPSQYAIRKKMEHAAHLLETYENYSILRIAHMVGFANPAHFSRTFRQQFGRAPRYWKSEARA